MLTEAMNNYEKALLSDPSNEPLKAAMQKLRDKIRKNHAAVKQETDAEGGDMDRQSIAPTPASFDGILDDVPSVIPTPIDPAYDVPSEDQNSTPPSLIGSVKHVANAIERLVSLFCTRAMV